MRLHESILSLLFYAATLFLCQAFSPTSLSSVAAKNVMHMSSFYDLTEKDAKGSDVKFDKFKGKVVYGVNVASKCGYTTSGYALLEKLSKMDGVEVLLFPCNQFGGQEPGSDAEVEQFCALKGVQGANVFTKADVNGPKTRSTYKFVKDKLSMGDIAWNFAGKFVVDKTGNVLPVKNEKNLIAEIEALTKK
jgi:glutathione peroxidase-family protein